MEKIEETPDFNKIQLMRERILNEYNIWPSVEKIVQTKM